MELCRRLIMVPVIKVDLYIKQHKNYIRNWCRCELYLSGAKFPCYLHAGTRLQHWNMIFVIIYRRD